MSVCLFISTLKYFSLEAGDSVCFLARSLCRDCGLGFACNAVSTPLFEL